MRKDPDQELRDAVLAEIRQHVIDSMTPDHGYLTPIGNVKPLIQRLVREARADAMLEAAKIASEYHTFGGVHQGLLRRAKELQEGK